MPSSPLPLPTTPSFRLDGKRALAQLPLGRFGKVEDLMGAILFLASDASAMITGAALVVDAGLTAR